jgi:hypothetical protein
MTRNVAAEVTHLSLERRSALQARLGALIDTQAEILGEPQGARPDSILVDEIAAKPVSIEEPSLTHPPTRVRVKVPDDLARRSAPTGDTGVSVSSDSDPEPAYSQSISRGLVLDIAELADKTASWPHDGSDLNIDLEIAIGSSQSGLLIGSSQSGFLIGSSQSGLVRYQKVRKIPLTITNGDVVISRKVLWVEPDGTIRTVEPGDGAAKEPGSQSQDGENRSH